MLKYIIKRVLIFIPTLIIISLITFIISINAPGDPVDSMLDKSSDSGRSSERITEERSYNEIRQKLGLNLPVFYFSFSSAASCDTLFRVSKKDHRENLERLAFTYGNWNEISEYYKTLSEFDITVASLPKEDTSIASVKIKLREMTNGLYRTFDEEKIKSVLHEVTLLIEENSSIHSISAIAAQLGNSFSAILQYQHPIKKYIPVFHFYGFKNQYHKWLLGDVPLFGEAGHDQTKGFLRGDFGISYQDKRPVSSVVWSAMSWTIGISIISIILAYFIAIPLGVFAAVKKGTAIEKSVTTFLFMLYSLPNFWLATMAVIFLCGGDWLSWFPSPGTDIDPDAGFMERFSIIAYQLVLPVILWTYGSLAFLSRQMRGGMLSVLGQDFIRTARAKGLKEKAVTWKHAFKNSLLPIITLFAAIFPLVISGSLVIEYIFSIPGIGRISYEALVARNYPIIFTVTMFTAVLTMVGNLIADILYAWVDPRISFSESKEK